MKTKSAFTLIVAIIAIVATACAPTTSVSAPVDPAPLAEREIVALVPVTGISAAEGQRLEMESSVYSGEIFLSDTNHPDAQLNVQTDAQQEVETGCVSEDSQPERQSGCLE